MKTKHNQKIILSFLLIVIMSFYSLYHVDALATKAQSVRTEEYQKIDKIIDYIKEHYYGEFNEKEVYELLIKSTLSGLDRHSYYMNPTESRSFIEHVEGNFFGIGIQVQKNDEGIVIVKVLEDTPAAKSNLEKGDLILSVDDTDITKMPLDKAVTLIRGQEGQLVRLQVKKQDATVVNVPVRRAQISNLSAQLEYVDGVAVLKLDDFSLNALEQFNKIMDKNRHLKKLIIDLRGNPGGLLNSAIAISDAFLPEGKVITTAKYKNQEPIVIKAQKGEFPMKLVVLIDENSASASEILAGALKENKRALVIGSRSYGKGSIQTFTDVLQDNSLVKLTIGEYLLPNGASINEIGIVPDIEVKREDATFEFYPMNSLSVSKLGSEDIDTFGMQQRLGLLGYSLKPTGVFDKHSEAFLKDWQSKNALEPTGILDVQTKIKLHASAMRAFVLNTDIVLDRAIVEIKKM